VRGSGRIGRIAAIAVVIACALAGVAVAATSFLQVGPDDKVTANLRHLDPYGRLTKVGNFPGGSALTPDGRFYWTVSAGYSENGVQIVSVDSGDVVQELELPGASGGVAIDGVNHKAYVSGEPNPDIDEFKAPEDEPGGDGDVVHVFSYSPDTGEASEDGVIPVPPPTTAPPVDSFPPSLPPKQQSWPERLAVSPDGGTLLVALGLADSAAVIDTATKQVSYVSTGSHPFGAAILPDGKTGLISNRGPGTVSVIDLAGASKVKDIQVGPHLSHPEEITLDPTRARAYVPMANADMVGVIDTDNLLLAKALDVTVPQGAGSAPLSTAVTPDGSRLLVAQSAGDELSVYAIDGGVPTNLIGRIPTADYPTDVSVAPKGQCGPPGGGPGGGGSNPSGGTAGSEGASATPPKKRKKHKRRHKKHKKHRQAHSASAGGGSAAAQPAEASCPSTLLWTAAKGFGLGPNAGPPITSQYFDIPPRLTTKGLVTGYAGIGPMPTDPELGPLTDRATEQLTSINAEDAPADTPLRPDGPIKHVFYIVKENRTYDQVLGDVSEGDGDSDYAIFGNQVTPNAHALVDRFPLLDHFYADSEASIDGHYWTAGADTSDYVHRTWRQNYAGRGYPSDAWFYQIAYPQTGFLFDRAQEQNVSYANLGEGVAHILPVPDRDKDLEDTLGQVNRLTHTDLGPYTAGCYDPFIGTDDLANAAHIPIRIYDSSKPAGAPALSLSRFDCFKSKFDGWSASDSLPQFVYMTLPNDHTNGGSPGHHTPRAMVADNDEALGQVVDEISHSKYWSSSAIFVVEDDSQDGFDHQDAHRIPAFAISPYAKDGVVSTPYDMVSAIRSMELILGLSPLNLFDSQAAPMYDAFTGTADNSSPFDAITPTYDLLEENPATPSGAAARAGTKFDTTLPDRIHQDLLDKIIWQSVHGPNSEPPPPGPNAEDESDGN
jgi:YVTN family beta-propeller protein